MIAVGTHVKHTMFEHKRGRVTAVEPGLYRVHWYLDSAGEPYERHDYLSARYIQELKPPRSNAEAVHLLEGAGSPIEETPATSIVKERFGASSRGRSIRGLGALSYIMQDTAIYVEGEPDFTEQLSDAIMRRRHSIADFVAPELPTVQPVGGRREPHVWSLNTPVTEPADYTLGRSYARLEQLSDVHRQDARRILSSFSNLND